MVISGAIPYALIRLGRPEEAMEVLARGVNGNDALAMPTLWIPAGCAARTLASFSSLARRIGVVDVWSKRVRRTSASEPDPARTSVGEGTGSAA
ncbi:MAG TPA: hypothetical protein VL915_02060 [Gemmatimonadales bacterium]|nr:hypothetical protein [Gemmatimonadales bacterium]